MLKRFKTKSAKGVISMLTGGVISKGVWAIFGLVLSKYYGAENFGIYNVFLGYLGIISVVSTFRLEHILVITKSPKKIFNFYSCLLLLSTLGAIGFSIVSFLIWWMGSESDNTNALTLWLLIAAGSLFSAWVLIQNALFTKLRFFHSISIGLVINTLIAILFQCLFYFVFPEKTGFYGLILGHIIGLLASIIYYFKSSRTKFQKFNWTDSKKLIKGNIDILKFTFPSESINTMANNLFIILAAIYFNKIEVGVFALALKILATPMVLLFNAFSKVYFQKAAQLVTTNRAGLLNLTLKVSGYSGIIYLIYLLVINTIGVSMLQKFYLPNEWPELSLYLLIISFWVLIRSIVSPISQIAIVINKNKFSLWMNIGLLLSNFVGVLAGYFYQNFVIALFVFSFSASIIYLIFYVVILIFLKKYNT